jgi:hypothetical protein
MWTKAFRASTNAPTKTTLKVACIEWPEGLLLTVKLCGIILLQPRMRGGFLTFMAPWLPALSAKLNSFKSQNTVFAVSRLIDRIFYSQCLRQKRCAAEDNHI